MGKNYHTDNKSFVIYKEWEELFEALDKDEEVSQLIKALFAFAKRGEEAEFSGALKIAFITMRNAIERDGKKWEQKCDKNAENVKKRWAKENTNAYERIQPNTNYTDNDKDNDNDKDKDKKPLILTTNIPLETLKNPSDMKYARMYSRILEMTVPIQSAGSDKRRTTHEENMKWAKAYFGGA